MAFRHNSNTDDNEPSWGSIDKTALPRLAFADMGQPEAKSTWKYPHHWVKGGTKKDENGIWTDGTMYLHKGGLKAAWAAANGARSGQDSSSAVKDHLQRHRNAIGVGAIGALTADAWLIEPAWLQTIYDIAMRNGEPESLSAKEPVVEEDIMMRDSTAVIPIRGPIFRYANLFTEISGATSTGKLAKNIESAGNNPKVNRIILDFDSPGGQVTGINELSLLIKEVAQKKPVIAYISGTGASAAYWLASAASRIVADATAIVGSIGVVATFKRQTDDTVEIVSTNAPEKRPDISTKEGQDSVRKTLDALAEVFVEAVAENRGVEKSVVLRDFGKGGVLVGKEALDVGMIDEINTFEKIVKEVVKMDINMETLAKENPDLLESIRKEARADLEAEKVRLESEKAELLRNAFHTKMVGLVGTDHVDAFMVLREDATEEAIEAVAVKFQTLQATIAELGKPKGETSEPVAPIDKDVIDEKKIAQIQEELNCSRTDALVELEKRRAE